MLIKFIQSDNMIYRFPVNILKIVCHFLMYIDIVATRVPTMVKDKGKKNLIFFRPSGCLQDLNKFFDINIKLSYTIFLFALLN